MEPLNTENRGEVAEYTDAEWDAELLSQFPEVGVTDSCGFSYGIEFTYQRPEAWSLLRQRMPEDEYAALVAAVQEAVGDSFLSAVG
jgi:hypothetical protein